MTFSRFDSDVKNVITLPIEKQKQMLKDIERRELVKNLPGEQKVRRVK